MGNVNDRINRVPKQRAAITTVDPSQRLIECVTSDGGIRRLAIFDVPSGFTWPRQDEEWSIYEENGQWYLGNRFLSTEENDIFTSLAPGQTYFRNGTYATTVGNGSEFSFTVTHNLGTEDIVVETHWLDDPKEIVETYRDIVDENTITIKTENDVPPIGVDSLRVVVMGGPPSYPIDTTSSISVLSTYTPPALVATLPVSPADGQEVYYLADSASGTIWHLRYRQLSPNAQKWEYVGGGDLYKKTNLNQAVTNTNTWDNLSTGSPTQVICPLAGVYEFWFHASGQEDLGGAVAGDVSMSVFDDGVQVTTANEAWARPTGAYHKWSLYNVARLTVGAGSVMQVRGNVVSGSWNNFHWYSADIRCRPVRLQ